MSANYLSNEPVSVGLTGYVASLNGKTVLVTEGDEQFIMSVLVVPEPGDNPKVCRVMLQDASVGTADSWESIECIPPAIGGQAAREYLTEEGLALVQPSQRTLLFGATLSLFLPKI